MTRWGQLDVRVSPALPRPLAPWDEATRLVRHGFAAIYSDFEEWAGPVGPGPRDLTHAVVGFDPARFDPEDEGSAVVYVSADLAGRLRVRQDMRPGGATYLERLDGLPLYKPYDAAATPPRAR